MIIRSSLVSGVYAAVGPTFRSTPTIAGTGRCGRPFSCWDHIGMVAKRSINKICFGMTNTRALEEEALRHHNAVARLQLHVLRRLYALDDFLIVEGKPCLCAIGILAQNID